MIAVWLSEPLGDRFIDAVSSGVTPAAARSRIGCVSLPTLFRVPGFLPLLIAATAEFFGTLVAVEHVYSISGPRDKYVIRMRIRDLTRSNVRIHPSPATARPGNKLPNTPSYRIHSRSASGRDRAGDRTPPAPLPAAKSLPHILLSCKKQ